MSGRRCREMSGRRCRDMSGRVSLLKVILVGDVEVGKSALTNRFITDTFDFRSFSTIGVDLLQKEVTVDGDTYVIQVWDTAGQERYKSLRTSFFRGADCCLITFAVNQRKSFANLPRWREEFLFYGDVENGFYFPFVVVGNKADVERSQREVTSDEASAWCSANGDVPYFETSAKDSTNVEQAFLAAVQRCRELGEHRAPRSPQDSPVEVIPAGKTETTSCWCTVL